MSQVKIVADDDLVSKFKQIAIIKHGKLDLISEGEEALRLYVQKHAHLLRKICPPKEDPLYKSLHNPLRSTKRQNALRDLKKLDRGEL